MIEWKTGEQVRLKSGGPVMTVDHVDLLEPVGVTCVWFDRATRREDSFDPGALAYAGE